MANWEDKPVDEWTDTDKKEMWRHVRKELWDGWKIVFVIQLILGSHVLYENAATMGDVGFLQYTFILLAVSVIAATILFIIITILFIIVGAIVVAIMMWQEDRKEKHNAR